MNTLMKEYNFFCGMPRAGSTLLSSLINQNPKICLTANSVLPDVLFQILNIKHQDIFKNFPDKKSIDNLSNSVFDNYYKNWKASIIIDKGPWGTPGNLMSLKTNFKKPKFIVLYRPVLECLASFVKIDKPKNINDYCDMRMSINGRIGKELWSIKNLIETKQNCHILTYKKLIKNPNKEIKKICKFLKIDFFKVNTKKFKQLKINGVVYNDSYLNSPLHKIRLGSIKANSTIVKKILPKSTIKKYSKLDVI